MPMLINRLFVLSTSIEVIEPGILDPVPVQIDTHRLGSSVLLACSVKQPLAGKVSFLSVTGHARY